MDMKQQNRVHLGTFPTPLVRAPDLGGLVGIQELWVKRDDLTGYSWGGNKIRTIEFLLQDIIDRGSCSVIVCGGTTSNFSALISVACARHGLSVHRVSYGSPPSRIPAALATSNQAGASIEYSGSSDRSSMDAVAESFADRLRAEGKRPYVIPRGGATAIGALGFANAALELSQQLRSKGIKKVSVVLPVGSGGTIAGLIAGWTFAFDTAQDNSDLEIQIVGVSVSRAADELTGIVASLASDCANQAGHRELQNENKSCRWRLVDGRGAGYGVASERDDILIDEVGSRTRFMVDATYNGKALAWLRESSGQFSSPVIYWHTGGALGVIDRLSARGIFPPFQLGESDQHVMKASDSNLDRLIPQFQESAS